MTQIWTDKDFEELSWYNSRMYGVVFPGRNHKMKLDVDYAVRRPNSKKVEKTWDLVPVELVFENVVGLVISLEMSNHTEIDIIEIKRRNRRLTPNRKLIYWDYEIDIAPGNFIRFSATSFTQTAVSDALSSISYDLGREKPI